MSKFTKVLFCAAIVLAICPALRATVIDAASDLNANMTASSPTNPYDNWTYGYAVGTLGAGTGSITSFAVLPRWPNAYGTAGVLGFALGSASNYAPAFVTNTTAANVTFGDDTFDYPLRPGEMAFGFYSHIQAAYYSDLRWTAPQAGTFTLSAAWTALVKAGSGADAGAGIQVHVIKNLTNHLYDGLAQASVDLGNPDGTSQLVTVAVGDTLDFVVGSGDNRGTSAGGGTSSDNLRFTGTITTPEPGTLVLLATGLIGLLAYAWRKRR